MIILTAAQADHVRGPTANGAYLDPRRMLLGTYALPEAVLTDPDHAMYWDYLRPLPRRPVLVAEWPIETIV